MAWQNISFRFFCNIIYIYSCFCGPEICTFIYIHTLKYNDVFENSQHIDCQINIDKVKYIIHLAMYKI